VPLQRAFAACLSQPTRADAARCIEMNASGSLLAVTYYTRICVYQVR
jgi:hypothetical protein